MAQCKIYLGNLSKSLTQATLSEHFAQFGEIEEVTLPLDRKTSEVKGYAFITFKLEKSAEESLAENGKEVFGQLITVEIAQEKPRAVKKKKK